MKQLFSLTAFFLLINMGLQAQSKKDLEASIATLTAKNDSLTKQLATAHEQNVTQTRLIDTLSVMTGVEVSDLDTVKSVMELRASARTANTDSLTKARSHAAKLQLAMDSLNLAYTKLQAECNAAHAAAPGTTDAPSSTGAISPSQTDQLMKLNGMFEQGLLTKDEFLKMKKDIVK